MLSYSSSHTPYPAVAQRQLVRRCFPGSQSPSCANSDRLRSSTFRLLKCAGPPRSLGTDRLKDDVGKLLRNTDCVKTARLPNVGFLPSIRCLALRATELAKCLTERKYWISIATPEYSEAARKTSRRDVGQGQRSSGSFVKSTKSRNERVLLSMLWGSARCGTPQFWHEPFLPLAAQEHALREKLIIVGQARATTS
jgi:hypothetical protein